MPERPTTSFVQDDVDPAPRILGIIAACLRHPKSRIAKDLRFAKNVLEGKTMNQAEANTILGRLLAQERRVKKARRETWSRYAVTADAPNPTALSPEDERALAKMRASGRAG